MEVFSRAMTTTTTELETQIRNLCSTKVASILQVV